MKTEEHNIQVSISQYLDLKRIFHFAIPNGGLRNKIVALSMKKEGVKAGVSDIIVLLKNKIIFVEVKTKTGKQRTTQQEFENKVKELGFEYIIWKSLDDAINFVEALKNGRI